jgi:hypothetical protein
MKKLTLYLFLLQSLLCLAQAPQKMAYQSVVRNAANQIVANQNIGVKISIVEGSLTGTTVYSETHTTTTNTNGLFTLEAGGGTPTTGTFSAINWGNGSHYIKSEIDVTGGTNYTLSGTMELLSVPYALYAVNGVPKGNNTGDLLSWNGTQWVPIANTAATTNINLPKVKTGSMEAYFCNNSTIISDEGFSITAKGVCWSLSPNPTLADNFSTDGQGIDPFNSTYQNLLPGRLYYVRAYATNARGTGYGMTNTFTSATTSPTITTAAVTSITNNNATCGGTLTNSNNIGFNSRGLVWSTSPNPTQSSNAGMATNGAGPGTFTVGISGLTPNTTYYIRAFGETSYTTLYGNQVTFTTGSLPYITTSAASEITNSTAISGGILTNPSGNPILAKGVVWGTSQNPTVALATKTMDGATEGNFTSTITGLNLGSTYFVRAYVTNALGTSYGNTITVRPASLPTITTTAVTSITNSSATCGGESITNGGSAIIEKGIVWSTSPNPTIDLSNKIVAGAYNASFSNIYMNDLNYSTTYYVRAFARNQVGTAYGQELVFSTRTLQANDSYLGGTIVYILQASDPGYIAGEIHGYMKSQLSDYIRQQKYWGCNNSYLGTTSAEFGTGESNTIEIVNNCPGDTAAKYCYDLVEGGYDDWFLPSIHEMDRFSSAYFWSNVFLITSSEISDSNCYYGYAGYSYYGINVSIYDRVKWYSNSFIPVRRF